MKKPKYAKLLLNKNVICPIVNIHFSTGQVTLKEKENIYNTVDIRNVEFDFSDFSETERQAFLLSFE